MATAYAKDPQEIDPSTAQSFEQFVEEVETLGTECLSLETETEGQAIGENTWAIPCVGEAEISPPCQQLILLATPDKDGIIRIGEQTFNIQNVKFVTGNVEAEAQKLVSEGPILEQDGTAAQAKVQKRRGRRSNKEIMAAEQENQSDEDEKAMIKTVVEERRSGRLPSRKRVVPSRFRDYRNPDAVDPEDIKQEPEDVLENPNFSQEKKDPAFIDYAYDYVKSQAKQATNFQRADGLVPRKRGRPRKYPDLVFQSSISDSDGAIAKETTNETVVCEPTSVQEKKSDANNEASADSGTCTPVVSSEGNASSTFKGNEESNPQSQTSDRGESLNSGSEDQRENVNVEIDETGDAGSEVATEIRKRKWESTETNEEEEKEAKEGEEEWQPKKKAYKQIHSYTRHYGSSLKQKCPECHKIFSNKGNLKTHLLIHTGIKPFKCDYANCDKSFRTNESLRRHRLSHMGVKPYQCSVCKMLFSSSASLQEHMNRHTSARPYVCNVCNKSFRQMSCLNRHHVIHSNELPFTCDICGRKFSLRVYLKSHMKTHTGERPYKCVTCSKAFAHQSDLNRHKIIHSGERPYKCSTCNVGFSDPSCRRRHEREHSLVKPYLCNLCQESFKKPGQLKTHLARKHMVDSLQTKDISIFKDNDGEMRIILKESGFDREVILNNDGVQLENIGGTAPQKQKIVKLIKDLNSSMVQHVQINLPSVEYEKEENNVMAVEVMEVDSVVDSIQSSTEQVSCDILESQQAVCSLDEQNVQDSDVITATVADEENGEETVIMISDMAQVVNSLGSKTEAVEYLQIIEELPPDSLEQQVIEVQCQEEEASPNVENSDVPKDDNIEHEQPLSSQTSTEIICEVENVTTYTEETEKDAKEEDESAVEKSSTVEEAETSASPAVAVEEGTGNQSRDYVTSPDFNSQQYYNWLSSFTELCKVVPMPLDMSLFQKISQVHKSLSDVMAIPSGVVADKDNFKILMNISRELNTIINEHLMYVMQNLHEGI